MQLDRTTIAIRERNLLDTLDLSLHVVRAYARPLLGTMALGVVPLMIVNYLLLNWMVGAADTEWAFPFRFAWHMTILVFLQAPLASVFATWYLGQAVFLERPRWRDIARGVSGMAPQLALCQLVLRGVGAAWLLELALDRYREFDPWLEGFLLFALVLVAAGLRAFRPFLNEIILLERNPLTSRNPRVITIGRRSTALHGANSGDLIARWLGAAVIGVCLFLACYGTCLFASGVFLNDWSQSTWLVRFCLPLSMWVVVGYLTVFRYLSYLDVRIRQEGWEVDLRLRAEARRLLDEGHG